MSLNAVKWGRQGLTPPSVGDRSSDRIHRQEFMPHGLAPHVHQIVRLELFACTDELDQPERGVPTAGPEQVFHGEAT
jgi:hypothetical protein